jgi:hypothetical protein
VQAVAAAQAAVPGGVVVEVASDDEHDRPVWRVTLATPTARVVVIVDAQTGHAELLCTR